MTLSKLVKVTSEPQSWTYTFYSIKNRWFLSEIEFVYLGLQTVDLYVLAEQVLKSCILQLQIEM